MSVALVVRLECGLAWHCNMGGVGMYHATLRNTGSSAATMRAVEVAPGSW